MTINHIDINLLSPQKRWIAFCFCNALFVLITHLLGAYNYLPEIIRMVFLYLICSPASLVNLCLCFLKSSYGNDSIFVAMTILQWPLLWGIGYGILKHKGTDTKTPLISFAIGLLVLCGITSFALYHILK